MRPKFVSPVISAIDAAVSISDLSSIVDFIRKSQPFCYIKYRPIHIGGHEFSFFESIGKDEQLWQLDHNLVVEVVASAVDLARKTSLPLYWDRICRDAPETPAARAVEKTYSQGALRGGVTLPLHGPNGDLGLLTYSLKGLRQCEGNDYDALLQSCLQFIGIRLQQRFTHIWQATTKRSLDLTGRERQCLEAAARGLRTKKIAFTLGLSEATVNAHLTAARLRLNAATTIEAAVKAAQNGLIRVG